MILALLLALAQQPAGSPAKPDPYRPAPATIVAEPVALFIAAADRDHDGRTTLAEFRQSVLESTSADPPWRAKGDTGIGYIQYSDWAERWLGDRNAVPTPFEIDRNGDSRVTYDEFADRMETLFARFDANTDGAITRAELLTIRNSALGRPERERRGRR
ncbi:MAG: EF-hand domain-containing protein [Pseudomonadota bacterium]